jgi:hypothetical protein
VAHERYLLVDETLATAKIVSRVLDGCAIDREIAARQVERAAAGRPSVSFASPPATQRT